MIVNTKEVDILGKSFSSYGASLLNLQVLGSGFEVISVGRRKLVRSVPTELNKDHSGILGLAQVCAFNTVIFNTTLLEAFKVLICTILYCIGKCNIPLVITSLAI